MKDEVWGFTANPKIKRKRKFIKIYQCEDVSNSKTIEEKINIELKVFPDYEYEDIKMSVIDDYTIVYLLILKKELI